MGGKLPRTDKSLTVLEWSPGQVTSVVPESPTGGCPHLYRGFQYFWKFNGLFHTFLKILGYCFSLSSQSFLSFFCTNHIYQQWRNFSPCFSAPFFPVDHCIHFPSRDSLSDDEDILGWDFLATASCTLLGPVGSATIVCERSTGCRKSKRRNIYDLCSDAERILALACSTLGRPWRRSLWRCMVWMGLR